MQEDRSRSFVVEEQSNGRRPRVLPLTGLPNALPQFFDLGLPGPEFDEEVEVMLRRSLTAVTLPEFIEHNYLRDSSQIWPIAAWPERSWKYRLATPLLSFRSSFRIFPPLGGRYRCSALFGANGGSRPSMDVFGANWRPRPTGDGPGQL